MRLARLPLAASLACASAGLTIAFVKSGHDDLAGTLLAFALVPPVVQVVAQSRRNYGSADIYDRKLAAWITLAPALIYLPVLLFCIIAITDWPQAQDTAQGVAYVAAFLLGIYGALVLAAVKQKLIPEHYCDVCSTRILWRRRQYLEASSRRTLCKKCAFERGVRRGR